MKHVGMIGCLLIGFSILLSSCESELTEPIIPGQPGGQQQTVQTGPRQTFASKGKENTFALKEAFPYEGLCDSKLELTLLEAKTYESIDQTVFLTNRFSADLKTYLNGNQVKSPYVFLTLEFHLKAIKGSDQLKDGYYIDGLRVMDFNKSIDRDVSGTRIANYVTPQYIHTNAEGDLKLSDTEKNFYRIHLVEGKSGNLVVGYFIERDSMKSSELYLAAGLSVEDSQYVPLSGLF